MGKARKYFLISGYLVATYLTIVFFGFGQTMQRLSQSPVPNPEYRGSGTGALTLFEWSGFGSGKSYHLRLEGNPDNFTIPSSLTNPASDENGGATVDLSQLLKVGQVVYAMAWPDGPPNSGVILGLELIRENGSREKILDFATSASRYVKSYKQAPAMAIWYIRLSFLPIPLTIMGHLFFILMLRKRRITRSA